MGEIIFEGNPPFDLPVAQTAEARVEGETVEMFLTVSVPEVKPTPVRIRVAMTWETAAKLGVQLGPVSATAERNARRTT
jgi:hypothetical protein